MKIEIHQGWSIYYSDYPSPLWTACKDAEKDIRSYFSVNALKAYIDGKEDKVKNENNNIITNRHSTIRLC